MEVGRGWERGRAHPPREPRMKSRRMATLRSEGHFSWSDFSRVLSRQSTCQAQRADPGGNYVLGTTHMLAMPPSWAHPVRAQKLAPWNSPMGGRLRSSLAHRAAGALCRARGTLTSKASPHPSPSSRYAQYRGPWDGAKEGPPSANTGSGSVRSGGHALLPQDCSPYTYQLLLQRTRPQVQRRHHNPPLGCSDLPLKAKGHLSVHTIVFLSLGRHRPRQWRQVTPLAELP